MPAGRVRKKKLYGKYRGAVVDNSDPEGRGRLRVSVPDALGRDPSNWAEACLPPIAGLPAPTRLPEIGAAIWVEFEGGDTSRPIWSGRQWPRPGDAPPPASITLGNPGGATLTISDLPGQGLTLKTASGAMLVIGDAGVTLTSGKGAWIELAGPSVSINRGALMVV